MTLRDIPSVEKILQNQKSSGLVKRFGRPLTLQAIHSVLAGLREEYSLEKANTVPKMEELLNRVENCLLGWDTLSLEPVINASGIILHTNLGRAPLSEAAIQAMESIARSYSNLEFDLDTGKRGSRLIHPENLLRRLTGAEDAMVVNNNAAAVLLILGSLAHRQRVIIARSQLIEIGGEFRLPDIMKQAGVKLVEVGTTNKTHLSDYKDALEEAAALVMHAHTSNYQIIGFTGEPEWKQVVEAAHAHNTVCLDDLGSGALHPTEKYGLAHEPTVQDSLSAGTDLVCFSGDKLLGGPQAGIILGKSELLARIKRHPLARAVRADKLCLSALNATLQHYLRDEAEKDIPVWRMLSRPLADIHRTAEKWVKEIGMGEVIEGQSAVGGGSLPGETLPTWLVSLDVEKPQTFLSTLRHQSPPIIARIENDHILLDPRKVLPFQENALLACLRQALENNTLPRSQGG